MAAVGHGEKTSPVIGEKMTEARSAQPHRPIEHCVEYWLEVATRGIDDLQYLGGRGLLLTRFGKFSLMLGKLMP